MPSSLIADLLKRLGNDGFIAGGYARERIHAALIPEVAVPPAADIDVFPVRIPDLCRAVVSSSGWHYKSSLPHATVWTHPDSLLTLQVVGEPRGDVRSTLIDFDYCASMYALSSQHEGFVATWDDNAPEDNKRRRLTLNCTTNPAGMIFRALKYAQKGYTLPVGTLYRLLDTFSDDPQRYLGYLDELSYGRTGVRS